MQICMVDMKNLRYVIVIMLLLKIHINILTTKIVELWYIPYRTNVWREKSLAKMLQMSIGEKSLANLQFTKKPYKERRYCSYIP